MRTTSDWWIRSVAIGCVLHGAVAMAEAGPIGEAISATKPIVDTRLRLEDVDQDPMTEDAEALTLRARLGFETGKAWNTSLLAEGEFVWSLQDDYNSTTNGNTTYPTVADPESHEVNRLLLTNTSLSNTTVTLGRQRINLDDQRFVGNVGWRQNEQTFDSLRIVNKSIAHLIIDVAYVDQVNRVFGKDSLQGRYTGDSFLANIGYQFPLGKLTGFGYWLDFDPIQGVPAAARDSSETFGLRFAGEHSVDGVKLAYAASYATQHEYADNPLHFDNDYYLAELTGTWRLFSLGAGVESLQGNGIKGFTTPLATLHKFQGWADKFLTTPPNGVDDKYLNVGATLKGVGPLDSIAGLASYHDYDAQRTAANYGSEIDVQLQAKWRHFTALLKYADYSADQFLTDTSKFWAQLEYVW